MAVCGKIHSFENSGTVDGPGIRFVVFMQGCLFRCLYCHNPDTWDLKSGNIYTASQVIEKIKRYVPYLKASGGGVTVSGGEPLLQVGFLTELFKLCKGLNLHTAIDTNGFIPATDNSSLDALMEYTDLVLLDIKHIDPVKHLELTGYSNTYTLEFAKYLERKNIPVWIRYVIVPGLTDDTTSLYALGDFIKSLRNIENIEILPFHNMGSHKWESLNINYTLDTTHIPTECEISKVRDILKIK